MKVSLYVEKRSGFVRVSQGLIES